MYHLWVNISGNLSVLVSTRKYIHNTYIHISLSLYFNICLLTYLYSLNELPYIKSRLRRPQNFLKAFQHFNTRRREKFCVQIRRFCLPDPLCSFLNLGQPNSFSIKLQIRLRDFDQWGSDSYLDLGYLIGTLSYFAVPTPKMYWLLITLSLLLKSIHLLLFSQ